MKTKVGDVWKVVLTGFGGSSTGKFMFSKEKISTVGISEISSNTFSVYPNPASEQVTLIIDAPSSVTINIYDLSGKIIYTQNSQGNGFRTQQINISDLNSGLYIIHFNDGENTYVQKLIKN